MRQAYASNQAKLIISGPMHCNIQCVTIQFNSFEFNCEEDAISAAIALLERRFQTLAEIRFLSRAAPLTQPTNFVSTESLGVRQEDIPDDH
jgi:hypothetical protein